MLQYNAQSCRFQGKLFVFHVLRFSWPFAEKLAGWLKTEAGKSRKQRRTVKQLHADLVALGFTGSYARVAAFARSWRADRQREQQTTGRGTFVPLHFDPGEAFQFDWSE